MNDAAAKDMSSITEATATENVSGSDSISSIANSMGVSPVAHMDDIPDGFTPSANKELINICQQDGTFVIADDGRVILSKATKTSLNRMRVAANRLISEGIKLTLIPATDYIVANILAKAEAYANHTPINEKSELTAAQKRLNLLIENAVDAEATDIHIIVNGKNLADIYYRVKGLLVDIDTNLPGKDYESMFRAAINYTAVMGSGQANKSFNARVDNDASFEVLINNKPVHIRFASVPNKDNGYSAVLRVLGANIDDMPSLSSLGYLPEHALIFEQSASLPYGGVVISGPTGSGKSTTLRSTMSLIPRNRRVYTFEDPIESVIDGASQVPIDPESEVTNWPRMTKISLRLDPDVLMYGEIREKEVAKIYTRAATTGHLVYTTLHTNSAIDVVPALNEMGISFLRLADPTFLRVIGAQRIVPSLCVHCRVPASEGLSDEDLSSSRIKYHFQDSLDSVFVESKVGCRECSYTGSGGRQILAEVINIDGADREYIKKGDTNAWLKHLTSKGWRDMKAHAEILVKQGKVCALRADSQLTTGFGIDTSTHEFNYNEFRVFAEARYAKAD